MKPSLTANNIAAAVTELQENGFLSLATLGQLSAQQLMAVMTIAAGHNEIDA